MGKQLKRVIFTCGGTAGHVNPAIAVAQLMAEKNPQIKILFVGAERGLEKDLIPKAGYEFRTVHISSFHRSLKPAEIKHNLVSLYNMVRSPAEARAILKEFRPDAVIGTGGYASYPTVKAAAKMGIPTAVHESNAVPGLTTELLEPYAGRIMVGFESCRQHYKHPERIAVTGTPVRGDFFRLTRDEARKKLGFDDEAPLVVSFWGSLGASHMNECMVDFFRREDAEGYPFRHIHAVGKGGWEAMEQKLRELGLPKSDRLDVRQYIYDMDVVMAAADVVLCRAGASTISELTALGKPTVMVPSPYVTNNHQEKNARLLEKHGGAVVITEPESTGDGLYKAVEAIHFEGMHYRHDIGGRAVKAGVRVGILGSTRGTDMVAIHEAIEAGRLNAKIACVVSNIKTAGILEKARAWDIPAFHVTGKDVSRETQEAEVIKVLESYGCDLVILIGYMRILTPYFFAHFHKRVINVHPSLLPEYAGGMNNNVHEAVLADKRLESGCTVHEVTPEVDAGAILYQKHVPVFSRDTVETLKARVQQAEGEALIHCIELYAEIFEANGCLDKLEAFASENGADFYGLPRNEDFIELEKKEWTVPENYTFGDSVVVPLKAGEALKIGRAHV